MQSFNPTSFSSVHHYLDAIFENRQPTADELQEARKHYWRAYNAKIHRERRTRNHYITLYFSKEEYEILKENLASQKNLTQQCKQLVLEGVYKDTPRRQIDTAIIEQELFELLHMLEAYYQKQQIISRNDLKKLKDTINQIQENIENL